MMTTTMLLTNVKLEGIKVKRRVIQNQRIEENNPLQGLYFDRRKNNNLVIENVNQEYFRRTVHEEHYSITQQHESVYVGQVTLSIGSNKNIANIIILNLIGGVFSLNELDVLGCDDTITNIGW